jgi:hypothetical protein
MGMDDYPDYTAPGANVASFWLAKVDWTKIPADYFTENYDDDDAEFNQFSADFRIGWYDHDIQETSCTSDGSEKPVFELLQGSWAPSYRDSVAHAATAAGYPNTSLIWIMFKFQYDPVASGVSESDFLLFLGVFDYDPEC